MGILAVRIKHKTLFIFAVGQFVFTGAVFCWASFFPNPSCRLYGDCTGQALMFSFLVFPFGFFAIMNLIISLLNIKNIWQNKAVLIALTINILYIGYWLAGLVVRLLFFTLFKKASFMF